MITNILKLFVILNKIMIIKFLIDIFIFIFILMTPNEFYVGYKNATRSFEKIEYIT